MNVLVNGESRELSSGMNVQRLLETLQIAPERVVVEVNLTILKRAQHSEVILGEGDRVEIVQFVGGGSIDIADCGLRNVEWRRS